MQIILGLKPPSQIKIEELMDPECITDNIELIILVLDYVWNN